MQPGKAKSVGALIDAAVGGELSRAQGLRLCKDHPEVITLALLAVGQRIAELKGKGTGSSHLRPRRRAWCRSMRSREFRAYYRERVQLEWKGERKNVGQTH